MIETNYKGIILAGGSGTRLYPVTRVVSKQLLPIYNKPMIYYPLSSLINSGVKEIMIITTPQDKILFQRLLGDGSQWGVSFEFAIQEKPEGIAQAIIIADEWLNGSAPILILGDNLFFGPNFFSIVNKSIKNNDGATIFAYNVKDPERFGVVEFDKNNNALSIEEKPKVPKSSWAVTGLYIFDTNAVDYVRNLKKSKRGEYEITDLNLKYLNDRKLKVILLDKKFSWLDTGTHESLLEASNFVKDTEKKFNTEITKL